MQEFRPAAVVAADTELAELVKIRDPAAIRSFVERYGAAVRASIVPAVGQGAAVEVTVDVFVDAAERPIEPGEDFAPWLAGIASERAGAVDEQRWELAMAIAAIDPAVRPALCDHHLDEPAELDDELARHELRLQRRLEHLGDPNDIAVALSEPAVWNGVDDAVVDRVLAALVVDPGASVADGDHDADWSATTPSRVSRGLRPVLFGLAGAVVVLFVAIVGLSAASGNPQQPDFTVELIPTGAVLDVEGGEITVTERDTGIEIVVDAITLPRRAGGLYYEGRIVLADGNEISVGTFSEGDGVTLWGGVALRDAVEFVIVLGDIERSGVDDVVLKVDLPRS